MYGVVLLIQQIYRSDLQISFGNLAEGFSNRHQGIDPLVSSGASIVSQSWPHFEAVGLAFCAPVLVIHWLWAVPRDWGM